LARWAKARRWSKFDLWVAGQRVCRKGAPGWNAWACHEGLPRQGSGASLGMACACATALGGPAKGVAGARSAVSGQGRGPDMKIPFTQIDIAAQWAIALERDLG